MMKEIIPKIKPNAVILLVSFNDLGLSISDDYRFFGSPYDYLRPSLKRFILLNSRLAQILYTWKLIIFNNVTRVRKSGYGEYIPSPLVDNNMVLPKDLKILLPSLEEFRTNVEEIIKIGKSQNIKMFFLTQPMLYDDTEYWRGIEGSFYWIKKPKYKISAANYWKLLDIFNKELIEICKVENVDCLDLASLIPHNDLYFYDSLHFNEQGSELVSDLIAEFLRGKLQLKIIDRKSHISKYN